ncbi:serine/threonine-protein kinase nek1-like isoform x2, partial [Plakobranchus ocellatus]
MNERRHKDLIEKQKIARINKAREDGWRALIDSPIPDEQNRPVTPKENPRPLPVPRVNVDNRDRGNYEAYNDFIEKLQRERQAAPAAPDRPDRNRNPNHIDVINMAVPRAVPVRQPPLQQQQQQPPPQNPFQQHQQNYMGPLGVPGAFDQAGRDRQKGAQAAERARVVEDYLERQRIAALNKRRAQHDLYGHQFARPSSADRRTPVPAPRRGASPGNVQRGGGRGGDGGGGGRGGGGGGGMLGRNREEQEYLEKLRQIRMQNAKDRRNLRNVAESAEPDKNPQDAEERKRKVEALKAQAEQWADLKKKELEKQRAQLIPGKPPSPAPAVPITGALHAIGAQDKAQGGPVLQEGGPKPAVPLTNAMNAIGASEVEERPKSALQKERDNVLKKLNAKNPGRGKWGAPGTPAVDPKEGAERGKWKSPVSPTTNLAVEDEAGAETARSQWGQGKDLHLSKVSLEQTGSQMEATTSADQVLKTSCSDDGIASSTEQDSDAKEQGNRSRWGRNSAVVKALDKMPICQDTVILDEASTPIPPVGVGSTITITPGNNNSKDDQPSTFPSDDDTKQASVTSKDIQIKPSRPLPLPLPPERSGTIVISRGTPGDKLPYTVPTVSTPLPPEKQGDIKTEQNQSGEQSNELPSSLHFQEIPPKSGQTPESPSHSQAALGEVELPSSIRFFETKATPREPATDEQAKRKLNTLVEVSESQSLSEGQQQTVQQDFQAYLSFKKSQEQGKHVQAVEEKTVEAAEPDQPDAKTLTKTQGTKGLLSDKWSTKSEDNRDGAKSVQMNLTSGNFDLRNIELLRTCSEPDLSSLFSTKSADSNVVDNSKELKSGTLKATTLKRHKSLDLNAVVEDDAQGDVEEDEFAEEDILMPDDDDDEEQDKESDDNNSGAEDGVDGGGEDDDGDGDDEDEDMKSMISTMQSILVEDEDPEDKKKTKVSFNVADDSNEDENEVESKSTKQKKSKIRKPSTPAPKGSRIGDGGDKADEDNDDYEKGGATATDHGDDGDDENEDDDDDEREKFELEAALELEN